MDELGFGGYGICEVCKQEYTHYSWCKECNAKHFQENFQNWTSGNDDVDKIIQDAQLSAINYLKTLEWIPYDKFYNIEYIAEGGFGKVYKANWIDGRITYWDNKNKNWYRKEPDISVALKSLNNSKNITLEFINEIALHHKVRGLPANIIRFYGITQDPETKNYIMVLDYAKNGNLRNYLDTNKSYSWRNKTVTLYHIASGLNIIHKNQLIHRDLHIGNILLNTGGSAHITDMGLCKPADYNTGSGIFGVLPYVAPEILRGQNYTIASDIYSFGIIMYEVFSGLPPYHDISHDEFLAIKICQGLRPTFNIKVPQLVVDLINECLDANPLNRPIADKLEQIWYFGFGQTAELARQFEEADEINKNSSTNNLSHETHLGAVYKSRLLNFNNLPEPKNSDDYYKQNGNIISTKFSVDFSQLYDTDDTNVYTVKNKK